LSLLNSELPIFNPIRATTALYAVQATSKSERKKTQVPPSFLENSAKFPTWHHSPFFSKFPTWHRSPLLPGVTPECIPGSSLFPFSNTLTWRDTRVSPFCHSAWRGTRVRSLPFLKLEILAWHPRANASRIFKVEYLGVTPEW